MIAGHAPDLADVLTHARQGALPFLCLDGTLVPTDRVAARRARLSLARGSGRVGAGARPLIAGALASVLVIVPVLVVATTAVMGGRLGDLNRLGNREPADRLRPQVGHRGVAVFSGWIVSAGLLGRLRLRCRRRRGRLLRIKHWHGFRHRARCWGGCWHGRWSDRVRNRLRHRGISRRRRNGNYQAGTC